MAANAEAQEQQEQKSQETVFPDQLSFRVFLGRVEEAAQSNRVKQDKIPIILEHLKEHFGYDSLPEFKWD